MLNIGDVVIVHGVNLCVEGVPKNLHQFFGVTLRFPSFRGVQDCGLYAPGEGPAEKFGCKFDSPVKFYISRFSPRIAGDQNLPCYLFEMELSPGLSGFTRLAAFFPNVAFPRGILQILVLANIFRRITFKNK